MKAQRSGWDAEGFDGVKESKGGGHARQKDQHNQRHGVVRSTVHESKTGKQPP